MDPWVFVFVIFVVLAAGTAHTVTGFGFALVAVPFLIIVLEPRDVVVFTALVALVNSSIIARSTSRHIPWRSVVVMVAGSVAGMPVGLAVLLLAPANALRVGVAVATMVLASALWVGIRFGRRGPAVEAGVGAIAGVLATSTGVNGPPIVLYLSDQRLPPSAFRGALSAFFVAGNAFSLIAFAIAGIIDWTPAVLAASALPALVLATVAGNLMLGRISQDVFRALVLGMLMIAALFAIATSLARIAG